MVQEESEKGKNNSSGSIIREILSGGITSKIILKNIWYVMLITFLALVYIANRFHAERITRDMNRMQKEVRELRAESLSTSADLMYASRLSEVNKLVQERGLGLEELENPAFKLLVDN